MSGNANISRSVCGRCGYTWVVTTTTPVCPVCGAAAGTGTAPPTIRLRGLGRLHWIAGIASIVVVMMLLGTVTTSAITKTGVGRTPVTIGSPVLGNTAVVPSGAISATPAALLSTPTEPAPTLTAIPPTPAETPSGDKEYQAAVQEMAAGQWGDAYKSLEASIVFNPTRTDALARMYDVNARLRPPIHLVSDLTSWKATAKAADGWNNQLTFNETDWSSPVPVTVDNGVPKLDDSQAKFIWAPNSSGDGADAYFRQVINLDAAPNSAKIQMNVDDNYELYINGTKVGEDQASGGWRTIENYDVATSLQAGKNLVAVHGHNLSGAFSFVFSMSIEQVGPLDPKVATALKTVPTPTQTPTATATVTSTSTATPDVRPLLGRLDAAWAKSDWPSAISTLQEIRKIAPDSKDYRDKLYTAYFAYGKVFLAKGDKNSAAAQFVLADGTDPTRGEAKAQLLALTPTSTPAPPTPTPLVCQRTFGDFCLVSTAGDNSGYVGYVTGVVINSGSHNYGYVQVEITLLDSSGAVVGSALANVNNLGPGETWKFKAAIFEEATRKYRVETITGF